MQNQQHQEMETSRRGINLIMGFGHLDLSELLPLEKAVNELQHCLSFSLTQNMFDALVSFAHSEGVKKLEVFKHKDAQLIADEMLRYCYIDGCKDAAAERRRRAERDLFLSDVVVCDNCYEQESDKADHHPSTKEAQKNHQDEKKSSPPPPKEGALKLVSNCAECVVDGALTCTEYAVKGTVKCAEYYVKGTVTLMEYTLKGEFVCMKYIVDKTFVGATYAVDGVSAGAKYAVDGVSAGVKYAVGGTVFAVGQVVKGTNFMKNYTKSAFEYMFGNFF